MTPRYLTGECLLWLDQGTRKQCQQPGRVQESAAQAAAHFWKKYGAAPKVIYIHPSAAEKPFQIDCGAIVVPKKGTLRRHYRVCAERDPNDKDMHQVPQDQATS